MHNLLTCLAVIAATLWTCATPPEAAAQPLKVGQKAPDFKLRDLSGKLVRLSDYAFKGKPRKGEEKKRVILDFFRTDCPPCKKELPEVIKYYRRHGDEGVVVILIALLEPDEGKGKLRVFLDENKVPFQVLLDPYELAAKKYIARDGSFDLPSIVAISPDGKVTHILRGLKTDLEAALK